MHLLVFLEDKRAENNWEYHMHLFKKKKRKKYVCKIYINTNNSCKRAYEKFYFMLKWRLRKHRLLQQLIFLTFVFGYSYLSEDKLLLIIDRIESICWYDFCAHLFPDGVSGQSIHVYFHIGTHFLVRQKLSRYNLKQTLHFLWLNYALFYMHW